MAGSAVAAALESNLIQSMKADWRKLVGSIVMICFALIAIYRWHHSHILFFLLLAFRDLVAGYFLAIRQSGITSSSISNRALAYTSSAIPLLYLQGTQSNHHLIIFALLLNILGFLVSTLATIELGDRMGVAPAKRGEICHSGVYKITRHPMYLGYFIAELGNVILNPLNAVIFAISIVGYILRAKRETKILSTKQQI